MHKKINLTIDSIKIEANSGDTILAAALANNIYIPNLCHHDDLKPVGVCRLCLVDIGGPKAATACNTPVVEGMVVRTNTPEIEKVRQIAIKLLLNYHAGECLTCGKGKDCELQRLADYMGITADELKGFIKAPRDLPLDTSNPFFDYDPNKCVLCGICVRTCDELQNINAIDYADRGYNTVVAPFAKEPWIDSRCESCGECVTRCPTGALTLKKDRLPPSHEVKTVCPYCGCGCVMYLGVRGNKIVSSRGDKTSLSNKGSLCVKGRFGFEFVNSPERLTKPLIKRDGKFVEASWEEALTLVASKLATHKGEQFAMLSSAKFTNEDNYVVQKFTRAVMGTNNIDHCARLCHAPSVAGLAQSFGSGAMTNSIQEISQAKCLFAIGTNTTEAHPIIALQMKKAAVNGAKLIVANPKWIDLCRHATLFLQHQPGTDVALMMGMARVIVDEDLYDKNFIKQRCENFDEFKKSLAKFDLDFVEKTTGVARDKIIQAARLYATNNPAAIFYAMGITQHSHGTDNVLATSNLALLTGNVGKPSSGVNPLRGQNNVQGACDMGALPNVYPAYQKVNNPEVQKKFAKAWGVKLDDKIGLTHTEIFTAIDDGKIKAFYIAGENPMLSEANANHVKKSLEKVSFLVVQDIFLTETAELADVVLPATTFAEKEGTFTNTERRIQRLHKVIPKVGGSKDDWQIICELAKLLKAAGFDFANAEEIMREIAALAPSYGGITYERLEHGGLQWPCVDAKSKGMQYLHQEKFATPDGKGQFKPLEFKPPMELPDKEYPLLLTTDRSLFHFHTATMSRKVAGLNELRPHEWIEMNAEDAKSLGVKDKEEVQIISRRGKIKAKVRLTEDTPVGIVCMTFHFNESPTNQLTSPAIDPVAKIPETKVCAVKVVRLK
jgi:formate dehydrogenase (NADP+) alpha subunit